ncbi:MAG: LON peptidase substrate-binding domain-containing protein [Planctomycetota bacterium]|nr:LON peptidase substrate-binding domain-containing protein [Planctomycetota bacterium]
MSFLQGQYIPVFPLPNVVLYPRIILPLHIFEPRYRLMLAQVLDSHGRIAMALTEEVEEDEGGVRVNPVMGVGQVISYEKRQNGTSDILLQGESRVRAVDWQDGPRYRLASFAKLEGIPPRTFVRRDELRRELKTWLGELTGHAGVGAGAEDGLVRLQQAFSWHRDLGFLADFLAHHFVDEIAERQVLLEELHMEKRARRLRSFLDRRWGVEREHGHPRGHRSPGKPRDPHRNRDGDGNRGGI